MDCRLNPAITDPANGPRMRPLLALLVIAPLLAGCFERGQTVAVDTPQPPPDDDAICRANNTQPGSPAYIVCRKERDTKSTRLRRRDRAVCRARALVTRDLPAPRLHGSPQILTVAPERDAHGRLA